MNYRAASLSVSDPALQAYLLGSVSFDAALALQRMLVYQTSGEREGGSLLMCEHPPMISVGRHGSRAHILYEPAELQNRGWPVRWVNRGGGCVLHLPGQLAIYPVLALDSRGWGIQTYVEQLQQVVLAVLDDLLQLNATLSPLMPQLIDPKDLDEVFTILKRIESHCSQK